MYNCGEDAGCSRNHKHMQIVQKPEALSPGTGFRFFPDVSDHNSTINVPYVYFLEYLQHEKLDDVDDILRIYRNAIRNCRKILGIEEDDEETVCPHNMILTKDWLLVIPRRTGAYKGVMVNAAGMMGLPTMSNKDLFAIWTNIGPRKALAEFGVARDICAA